MTPFDINDSTERLYLKTAQNHLNWNVKTESLTPNDLTTNNLLV